MHEYLWNNFFKIHWCIPGAFYIMRLNHFNKDKKIFCGIIKTHFFNKFYCSIQNYA